MRVLSRKTRSSLTILSILLGLVGCSSTPHTETSSSATATLPQVAPRPQEIRTAPVESSRPAYAGPWEDPSSPLYGRIIYFDYDSAEIKPEYVALMRTHAHYLGGKDRVKVTLEGHTDERGTREYNLALGDRRAETVRRFMLAEGVLPDQMATLSYGEERPADGGHAEAAWRQNRRVIIQY